MAFFSLVADVWMLITAKNSSEMLIEGMARDIRFGIVREREREDRESRWQKRLLHAIVQQDG